MTPDIVSEVIARLQQTVPELKQVAGALVLADLMNRKTIPQTLPAAFVFSQELTAKPDALLGMAHEQELTETVAVVVVDRHANDRHGGRLAADMHTLRDAVRTALAGWTPAPQAVAPLNFSSARLTGYGGGAGFLHMTFVTSWYG